MWLNFGQNWNRNQDKSNNQFQNWAIKYKIEHSSTGFIYNNVVLFDHDSYVST